MPSSGKTLLVRRTSWTAGFSVVETLIAAVLLLIVFFMMAQAYTRGRVLLDHEEDRRRATAVLQARLDGIRRDFTYDNLGSLAGSDTTYVVDDLAYTVSHQVLVGTPEVHATTLTLTVTWNAVVDGTNVPRSHSCVTILARGLPWSV
jgi:hypothetical protein